MFEFVRKHNRLLQLLLALLIVPSFILVGVQGYTSFQDSANATVAEVNGQPITQAEWDAEHQRQIERIRSQMPTVDVKLLDSPEMKRRTLDNMIQDRVLATAALKMHLQASDQQLVQALNTLPDLAALRGPDGRLDREQYRQLLQAQGLTPEIFEERLRQDLARRQVIFGIGDSSIAPPRVVRSNLDAFLQQREVQVQRFDAQAFLPQVNPTDAQVQAYYDNPAHQAQFRTSEQASIEYVVLDLEALKAGVTVTEKDLRDYYEQNQSRFGTPEERHAAHILVAADKSAPAAEREKAKAKAQSLLADVRKNPNAFGDLAKQHSDDPGSKAQGGDLGFFSRQAMVKPFADAAFAMKPGEISDVVESDFGFHIIKLLEVRGGEKKPFEEVRATIEDEVKRQLAQRRYAEAAEQFSNLVYEQSDTLQPVVDRLKLEKKTAVVQREPQPNAQGVLASPKFLEAVFAAETLRNKRNTEAIELGNNTLASARVVQHMPARVPPLAEIKDRVRQRVALEQAAALARQAGTQRIQALQANPSDVNGLSQPVTVSRPNPAGLPRPVVERVLQADTRKLPNVFGVDLGDAGYTVVRLNKVEAPTLQAQEIEGARASYAQAFSAAEAQAYLDALKRRYKVEVKVPAGTAAEGAAPAASR